jgi:hypothetical protein
MFETVMPTRSTESMSGVGDGALERIAGAKKRNSPKMVM